MLIAMPVPESENDLLAEPAPGPAATDPAAFAPRLLATLRREAGALAAALWVERDGGLCLVAVDPPGLPLAEVVPHPGSEAAEAIEAGALRLVAITPPADGPPLLQDRIGAARMAVLPFVSEPAGPAGGICLFLGEGPPPEADRLFAWGRWASLCEAFLSQVSAPLSPAPAAGPARPEMPALEELAGELARRVSERLAAVRPALHQAGRLTDEDAPARRFLRYALEGLDRADALLERLQVFAGSRELRISVHDPRTAAADVIRSLETERPPQVRLSARLAAELPRPAGDRELITRAVTELVRNALEAAPGGTEVVLEVTAEEEGIRYEVRDEGAGMDPGVLRRALEPFFTTRRPDTHLGLGLAFVQGVARRHGGWLTLSSTVGAGTVVRLWLPLQPGD
jgi:anti-sigma regulatory factor (Ser/Thr protein kinase)